MSSLEYKCLYISLTFVLTMLKLKNRKIVKINYSLLITLPKVWVNHWGLRKGYYIAMEIDDDNNLKLKPIKKGGDKK